LTVVFFQSHAAFVSLIQDCFRTMKDRGELDGIDEAWPERKKAAPAKEEKSVSTTERNDDEQEEELNENREA